MTADAHFGPDEQLLARRLSNSALRSKPFLRARRARGALDRAIRAGQDGVMVPAPAGGRSFGQDRIRIR